MHLAPPNPNKKGRHASAAPFRYLCLRELLRNPCRNRLRCNRCCAIGAGLRRIDVGLLLGGALTFKEKAVGEDYWQQETPMCLHAYMVSHEGASFRTPGCPGKHTLEFRKVLKIQAKSKLSMSA